MVPRGNLLCLLRSTHQLRRWKSKTFWQMFRDTKLLKTCILFGNSFSWMSDITLSKKWCKPWNTSSTWRPHNESVTIKYWNGFAFAFQNLSMNITSIFWKKMNRISKHQHEYWDKCKLNEVRLDSSFKKDGFSIKLGNHLVLRLLLSKKNTMTQKKQVKIRKGFKLRTCQNHPEETQEV